MFMWEENGLHSVKQTNRQADCRLTNASFTSISVPERLHQQHTVYATVKLRIVGHLSIFTPHHLA